MAKKIFSNKGIIVKSLKDFDNEHKSGVVCMTLKKKIAEIIITEPYLKFESSYRQLERREIINLEVKRQVGVIKVDRNRLIINYKEVILLSTHWRSSY